MSAEGNVHMAQASEVLPFEALGVGDTALAGGKGANLGEMSQAGFPVPPGFVIGAPAYLHAMADGGVRADLVDIERSIDVDDAGKLAEGASRLQELVRKAGLPPALRAELLESYHRLGTNLRVAVRSSATAEDTADASFAGMNQTFTNVSDDEDLCRRVVECWSSLFGERVVAYRRTRGVAGEPAMAVVVQEMVESERSGVMFTVDPSTGDPSMIVIEGALGLGEVVVGGQVEPDTYRVAKEGPRLADVRVGVQSFMITADPRGGDRRIPLDAADGGRRVLGDDEVLELARLAIRVEQHYGKPQDMEWAIAGGRIFLVQSRPITTLGNAPAAPPTAVPGAGDVVLVRGLGASPGVAVGRVRVISAPAEGEALQPGEVLVARMTSPDWVPVLRRAGALVTDGGGMTCHAAIVEPRARCSVRRRHAPRDRGVAGRRARHGRRREGRRPRGGPRAEGLARIVRAFGFDPGPTVDGAARHEAVRESGGGGSGRTRRRDARRRGRLAASRIPAHRGAGRSPSTRGHRDG